MAASSLKLLTECYASSDSSSSDEDDQQQPEDSADTKRKTDQDYLAGEAKRSKRSPILDDSSVIATTDQDEELVLPKGREPLPVLPSIRNLFASETRVGPLIEEEAKFHQGRTRSFPHQAGNWATYVYVPFDPGTVFLDLATVLTQKCDDVTMVLAEHFHISVSRTVVIRYHWIANLVASLRKSINGLESFQLSLNCLEVYCNEDKTRTFLGLKIDSGVEKLKRIVRIIDTLYADFKLPAFYESPSFHMSIAWCVGDKSRELEKLMPRLQLECENYVLKSEECRTAEVKGVELKTGNKTFSIPFCA